jgi:UDP-3-O-[3-hydroxymyristoyl] glucosamine N-acyltransferase
MAQPIFFKQPSSSTLADIAALTKALLVDSSRANQEIRGLASLDEAGPMHLAFFDNLKYADHLASTKAGAVLVSSRFEAKVPAHVAVLRAAKPFHAFVQVAREWHADALRPQSWFATDGIAPSAIIDPSARLEDGVIVDPLAVIGPRVEIGSSTVIGAGAVIAADVRIGRDCNDRRKNHDPVRADRQRRPDPSRLQHRPGRLRLHLLRAGGASEGAPDRPRGDQNNVEVGAGTTIDAAPCDTVIGGGH